MMLSLMQNTVKKSQKDVATYGAELHEENIK